MARLRNGKTGVVVKVSDEIASRLSGYEPAEAEKPKPERKRSAKKSTDTESDN